MTGQNLNTIPDKIDPRPREDPVPSLLKNSFVYQGKEVPNLITDYDLLGFGEGIVKFKAKELSKLII
jgi:hypothetical protein